MSCVWTPSHPQHLTREPSSPKARGTAKRRSAVSDGGEDQGAEEAFIGHEEGEEASRQFWKEPSRASFQREEITGACDQQARVAS